MDIRLFSDFQCRVKGFAVVSGMFSLFSVACLFSLVLLCASCTRCLGCQGFFKLCCFRLFWDVQVAFVVKIVLLEVSVG